jgi:hypothetical protein
MTRYKGDPYPLTCKFGKCKKCGKPMAGQAGYYWPSVKAVYCEDCGAAEYQSFLSNAADEDVYNGCGTAY